MSLEFGRAEYVEPRVIEGELSAGQTADRGAAAFPLALAFGAAATILATLAYGIISLSGFMFSIVAVGVGWLIARAMMTASQGYGGRRYQIAAATLTYVAVSGGHVFVLYWLGRTRLASFGYHPLWLAESLVNYAITWPIVSLHRPVNGAIGLLFLFWGMQTAWRMGAGSPGFGNGGPRITPFG